MSVPDWLTGAVGKLLQECGRDPDFGLCPLAGGANNRVFRVQHDRGDLLLKWYFADPADPRDRLRAEWDFMALAWHYGVRQLPQPLARDRARRLGLYAFVAGRLLAPHEVTRRHVQMAADFCRAVNRLRDTEEAARLDAASEACFTMDEHLRCVRGRVERLRRAVAGEQVPPEARRWVTEQLVPQWEELEKKTRRDAVHQGIDLHAELPRAARILSPSDFGFHNALLGASGELTFIDFEYAGWDDPAKTICDFFCQVAIPAPKTCLGEFADALLQGIPGGSRHRRRADLLMPVYRVKWCCIVLNPLLDVGRRRRAFRGCAEDARAEVEGFHPYLDRVQWILQDGG